MILQKYYYKTSIRIFKFLKSIECDISLILIWHIKRTYKAQSHRALIDKKEFYVITDIYKCLFSPISTKCHSN